MRLNRRKGVGSGTKPETEQPEEPTVHVHKHAALTLSIPGEHIVTFLKELLLDHLPEGVVPPTSLEDVDLEFHIEDIEGNQTCGTLDTLEFSYNIYENSQGKVLFKFPLVKK